MSASVAPGLPATLSPVAPARPRATSLPGWARVYLALAILLIPIVQPAGPAQTAIVDLVNLIALGFFAIHVLGRGQVIRFPFAPAIFLIAIGSMVATMSAEAPGFSLLTMAQDTYLYLWFVMIVNLLDDPEEHRRARIAWMAAALITAIVALAMLELGSPGALAHFTSARGIRAAGTLTNPNMLADYVVASFFVVLSLGGQVPGLFRWATLGFLLAALVMTKSNGGLLTLAVGGVAWTAVRAFTRRLPAAALVGAGLTIAGTIAVLAWFALSSGIGAENVRALRERSFLGRATHSSESRMNIWLELRGRYAEHPMGIGPGNSRFQRLPIGGRQRPDSFLGKTAHNDYVSYLFERGPIALAGLLILVGWAFVSVIAAWRSGADRGWSMGEGGALAAALIAVLAASSFHSIMIEKLHFRHFWFLLALLAAFRPPSIGKRAPSLART